MKEFLIIGLGSIGRRHTRNLAACCPNAHFTFLRHSDNSDPLVDELGGTVVSRCPNDLSQFDLVVLATPSALHIDLLPRLIASGVTLFVEKPIVTTLADCDAIDTMLTNAPDALRVSGFNFRYVNSLLKARALIQENRLGKIVRASFKAGQWLPDWRPTQDYRTVYSASSALGGGVELDLVHEVDVARWFFGDLKLNYAVGRKISGLEIDTNDVSMMILTPRDGDTLIEITLDYVSRQRVRRYEVVGEQGSLVWDIEGRLDLRGPKDATWSFDSATGGFDIGASYISMMSQLLEASNGGGSAALQSLQDGVASTRIAIEAQIGESL